MKKSFVSLLLLASVGVIAQQQHVSSKMDIPFPFSPFQPDLTPGYVLIEGDIQIPIDKYTSLLEASKGNFVLNGTYGPATLWPSNTVPYDFVTIGTGAVSAANQTNAIHAMDSIAARAGVTFRAAVASDSNRITFQNSSLNNSPVGMQGGSQIINIFNWGLYAIICHEIYHSLGFQHEQSRPDRDTYVSINTANICGTASAGGCAPATCCQCKDGMGTCISCEFNFSIVSGSSTYGPYDFDSFMHYGNNSFTCNGMSTITVNPPYTNTIGQRNHFSYFDGITCRALYPFANDRWLDRGYSGSTDGSFDKPFNNQTLPGALTGVPSGGTLLIKFANTYSAVGRYTVPVKIIAPMGATLGN